MKNAILMHKWEQCFAKHRFAMEHQFSPGTCSKENDGVIRRFMTSEHATSRYVVPHPYNLPVLNRLTQIFAAENVSDTRKTSFLDEDVCHNRCVD